MERDGKLWKVIEYYGTFWKAMEGHGRLWKVLESSGRSWNDYVILKELVYIKLTYTSKQRDPPLTFGST